jgi:NAD(P)H dehydrogenase (quinone)
MPPRLSGTTKPIPDLYHSPDPCDGAAGRLGAVGRTVVDLLRQREFPVHTLVRREDQRAEALRALGAEVVIGALIEPADVARALKGCRRMYFGMSVSTSYLEATAVAAAVAREYDDLEILVNVS